MALVIKNGNIITAAEMFTADIRIEGEKICQVGIVSESAADEIIDASGKMILPGGVDVHTHFDLPMFGTVSSDDHYSGHKAAAIGGTTTVIDFISQDYDDLGKCVEAWHAKADDKAAIDFGFHMNITRMSGGIEGDIRRLLDWGISSIKVFMAYNNRLRLADHDIFRVLRIAKECGLLPMLHAENGDIIEMLVQEAVTQGAMTPEWHGRTRPAWSAVEAALRGAAIAGMADSPLYLVHMNTAGEVDMLRYAREHGVAMMGETCPQYLFFTDDHLRRPDGAKWVCSPPVRTGKDNQRLWEGLTEGWIQTVGTDHCPFFYDGTRAIQYEDQAICIPGKELGQVDFTKIPNGLPGVGDRMIILWTYGVRAGRLSPNQFVALTSTNPAKIFGLYPQKGTILPGSDADIVIWDPEERITYGVDYAAHRTDYNLFEGWEVVGVPIKVLLRGKLIVDHHQWLGRRGWGKYLVRKPGMIL